MGSSMNLFKKYVVSEKKILIKFESSFSDTLFNRLILMIQLYRWKVE
jgi:hypothetical protein